MMRRLATLPGLGRVSTAVRRALPHPDREIAAPEFDPAYYLQANPDVAKSGIDPLTHFLEFGWREGRDPSPRFSVRGYLDTNPDVAEAGINPLIHYLKAGRREGRQTSLDLGYRYEVIRQLVPVPDQIAAALKAQADAPLGSADKLAAGLAKARGGLVAAHLTFSHDDYRTRVGGIQLCVQREAARLAELGRDHLHIFPVESWPVVRAGGEAGRLSVLLNGEPLGTYAPAVIAEALRRACPAPSLSRSFAVHSLLGHAADETVEIIAAAGLAAGYFWLHDYASLCADFNLLRNGVEDCGAPPPDSGACGVCLFGPARAAQVAAHETLFRRLQITVISPAESTLIFWRCNWTGPAADAVVLPHARLEPRSRAPETPKDRPLRVAFVGFPVAHKGWPLFRELALTHADDPRYQFLHLGAEAEPGLPVAFHDVRISPARPRAMLEALEAHAVDVLVFWPPWRETFSFTVYEAVAAGCAVVTGPDSGNVAAVVAQHGQGWVSPDEAAVIRAFESGEVLSLARAVRRPMLYDLILSHMTLDLITPGDAA